LYNLHRQAGIGVKANIFCRKLVIAVKKPLQIRNTFEKRLIPKADSDKT